METGKRENRTARPDPLEGFGRFCGLEPVEIGEGVCSYRCQIGEKHLNPHGFAHGGILFTLMDTAAGAAAGTLHRNVVTQCGGVHFLRPAMPGLVTATARVLKSGRHTALLIAEVFDEQGKRLSYGDFEIFYVK